MARGKRQHPPLQAELNCIQQPEASIIYIHILHGESIQVAVHSQTTVDDVLTLCCEFFDVRVQVCISARIPILVPRPIKMRGSAYAKLS
jgi:hypothetical protein